MRRFVVFGILGLLVNFAFAQERFTLLDTVQIEEIVSYGSLKKYQSGAKIEQIVITSYSIHYTKLYDLPISSRRCISATGHLLSDGITCFPKDCSVTSP